MRLFLLLFLFFSMASCGVHTTGWQSNDLPGNFNASFTKLQGKEVKTVQAQKEDVLVLSYVVAVTQGTLTLSVEKGPRILWQKTLSGGSDTAEVQLPITEGGMYKIVAAGKNAAGEFTVHYKTLPPKTIGVKINKNIELFGLLMQIDAGASLANSTDTVLIENKRATWRDWYAMTWKNYQRYKQFDSSRLVQAYRNYAGSGFSDDAFIGFLLQVAEVPAAKIGMNTDTAAIMAFSKTGDWDDAKKAATAFLNLFNQFYNDVHFENYLSENEPYYSRIKADVEKNRPSAYFLPTMEQFYQKAFNAYYLVPSLNIPTSMGFGKMHQATKTIYNTFGPFSFQSFDPKNVVLAFDYPDRIQGLSVHEFGHSFVNPAIDKIPQALIDSTAYLYTPIKDEMSKRAYTSWTACLYEHFVHAGEVLIARKLGDEKGAAKMIADNVNAKFIYLPFIVHELEAYDKNKAAYPSYDAFVLQVMRRLQATAKP